MTVSQLREQLAAFDETLNVLVRVEWDDDDVIIGIPFGVREAIDPDTADREIYIECEQE